MECVILLKREGLLWRSKFEYFLSWLLRHLVLKFQKQNLFVRADIRGVHATPHLDWPCALMAVIIKIDSLLLFIKVHKVPISIVKV